MEERIWSPEHLSTLAEHTLECATQSRIPGAKHTGYPPIVSSCCPHLTAVPGDITSHTCRKPVCQWIELPCHKESASPEGRGHGITGTVLCTAGCLPNEPCSPGRASAGYLHKEVNSSSISQVKMWILGETEKRVVWSCV